MSNVRDGYKEKGMRYSKGFLKSTAKDYDMTIEQVELATNNCETTSEFYDALEREFENRQRMNKPTNKHTQADLAIKSLDKKHKEY